MWGARGTRGGGWEARVKLRDAPGEGGGGGLRVEGVGRGAYITVVIITRAGLGCGCAPGRKGLGLLGDERSTGATQD